MSHRAKLAGLALLCFALSSQALTLGRVQGVALLGQALNVVVPIQLDASEEASAQCFEAEVFHADTRQPASRVRVQVEARPQATELRIQSSTPIDEPVVTVYLRSGCAGQKTTRRYVLLTDIPVEVASPALPTVPRLEPLAAPATQGAPAPLDASASPAPTTAARTSPALRAKAGRARSAGQQPAARKERGTAMNAARPRPKATAQRPDKNARPAGRARLQLDPLAFLSDRIANLEAPAPVTQTQDALLNIQRMATLEASVKTLLASAAQNEARLADLKLRLQKAESERFPPGAVHALLALLLACLLALAWLWKRQRDARAGAEPWWSDSLYVPAAEAQAPAPDATPEPARKSGATPAVAAAPALDVDLMDGDDSGFDLFLPAPTPEPPAPMPESAAPLPALTPAPARELNFETRLDIRQQAEFLVSLGQTDQAVHILQQELDPGTPPNPFVCLDLLKLVHGLGLNAEFATLRALFQLNFNARVPEFERFADPGRNLEAYPELLARITALWPTPEVLDVIDASLAAQAGQTPPFDLAAYRELLLLHTLAHGLAAQADLGLDIDLSATPSVSATPTVDVPMDDIPAPAESGNLIEFELPPAQR